MGFCSLLLRTMPSRKVRESRAKGGADGTVLAIGYWVLGIGSEGENRALSSEDGGPEAKTGKQ